MKRTKRNNRRLKGGSNTLSSTKKNTEKKVKFADDKDTFKIDILPEHTYVINVKPDPTKSGPPILKIKESEVPDGVLPRPGPLDFTGVNKSKKYNLGPYDKTSRCKKTGKKACEIVNEEIRKSKSKSKGGKKTLKKRKRKTNKK